MAKVNGGSCGIVRADTDRAHVLAGSAARAEDGRISVDNGASTSRRGNKSVTVGYGSAFVEALGASTRASIAHSATCISTYFTARILNAVSSNAD